MSTIGFSVSTARLLWRALLLARTTSQPFLFTVRGGYLRLAICQPTLLVVLLEAIRPAPGRTFPADLDLVLNGGALEGAMATMLTTRRNDRRNADLVFLHSPGDTALRLRCGIDFAEVPLVTTSVQRYTDQQLVDTIGGPHLPSLNRYASQHLDLLRALLEPACIQPHLSTCVPELRNDEANLFGLSAQDRELHLDRAAEIVQRSPGVYVDQHLIVRIQPDPDGVLLPGNDPDPDHPDR